ncbi:MAG: ATP-binding protein [Thermodesulfobacteriota bacterium]
MRHRRAGNRLLVTVMIVALAAVAVLPLLTGFYIIPAYRQLIIDHVEREQVDRVGRLLAAVDIPARLAAGVPLEPERVERIHQFQQIAGLDKIKFFTPEGIVVHSTEADDIGQPTNKTFFPAMLADGRPRSVFGDEEGDFLSIETYVPLFRQGQALGVCEIYHDVANLHAALRQVTLRGVAAVSLLVLVLFAGILLSLWAALGYLREKEGTQAVNQTLQRQLHRQQWMESLSMLVGGVTHDFNNLLTALMGNVEMARRLAGEPQKSRVFLEMAGPPLAEMKRLLDRLLIFSKSARQEGEPLTARELVAGVEETLAARGDIVLEMAVAAELPPVLGRKEQLRRLVDCLLTNAMEAMAEGGGTLRISAAEAEFDADNPHALDAGRYLHLAMRDSGRGIAGEDLEKIFVPYFTTKERGSAKGIGLGLTICYVIARQHGGEIIAESEKGRGTTMHVYLPLAVPPR